MNDARAVRACAQAVIFPIFMYILVSLYPGYRPVSAQ